jgi:hypothetical protein
LFNAKNVTGLRKTGENLPHCHSLLQMHYCKDDPFYMMPRLIPSELDSRQRSDGGGGGDDDDEKAEPLNLSLSGAENW